VEELAIAAPVAKSVRIFEQLRPLALVLVVIASRTIPFQLPVTFPISAVALCASFDETRAFALETIVALAFEEILAHITHFALNICFAQNN
jgi:hypothetical protein